MSHIRKIGKNYAIEFYWRGKKYCRSLRTSDRHRAIILQGKIDYDIALNIFQPESLNKQNIPYASIAEFVEQFNEHMQRLRNNYSDRTIQAYEYAGRILAQLCGKKFVHQITPAIINEEILPILFDRYSHASVRHFLIDFRTIFSYAVSLNLIPKNPFSKMVPRAQKRVPRYLHKDEIEIINQYFRKRNIPRWQHDLIYLALNTGLRKLELFNLKWENVDLINEQLIFSGKGNKERLVPLNDQAMAILSRRPRHIRNRRVFYEIHHPDSIGTAWRKVKLRTGINARFHDLRSTFASYYVMNGGSIKRLQEIMGHEDIHTVLIYTTLSPESIQKDKNIVNF